jgi:DNA-binding response OmpR family regulator
MRILVVEDDLGNRKMIEHVLKKEGGDVSPVETGREGLDLALNEPFDCIIMDLGLPDIDGTDVVKELRNSKLNTPVIILSAAIELDSKLKGLELGADDYMTKPFEPLELVARVNAQIRRATEYSDRSNEILKCGEIVLNLLDRTCEIAGSQVILTNNEFNLLSYFMHHPGETLSRMQISKDVWGIDFDTHTNFVNVYISYLRHKIAECTEEEYIETQRGKGFRIRCE